MTAAATISVEPPSPREAGDYHCSACRRRHVPVIALVTFGGRSFALCHVCGRELAVRLARLCGLASAGELPAGPEVAADVDDMAWFTRPLPGDPP